MLRRRLTAVLAATAFWTGSAHAAQEPGSASDQAAMTRTDAAFDTAATLGDGDLGSVAGKEDVGAQIASADQRNTVSNNSVTGNSTTGAVRIDGNAFQNLQGLAVINANSGNNVAINSAMNVTINLGGPQ